MRNEIKELRKALAIFFIGILALCYLAFLIFGKNPNKLLLIILTPVCFAAAFFLILLLSSLLSRYVTTKTRETVLSVLLIVGICLFVAMSVYFIRSIPNIISPIFGVADGIVLATLRELSSAE